jgi:hypothetical protein
MGTKLSGLQKLILVILLDERNLVLERSALALKIKRLYWGERHMLLKPQLVTKSLSRALLHLERRGLLIRTRSVWDLSVTPGSSGYAAALQAWETDQELYTRLSLQGPESKTEEKPAKKLERRGVEVELHFEAAFAEMAKDKKVLAEVHAMEGTLSDGLEKD